MQINLFAFGFCLGMAVWSLRIHRGIRRTTGARDGFGLFVVISNFLFAALNLGFYLTLRGGAA